MPTEYQYSELVAHAFNLPGFTEAWSDVGEAGASSEEALFKAWTLVSSSDWHTKFLQGEMRDIMLNAAKWADTIDMKRDEITNPDCPTGAFAADLLNQLRTIAAGYIVVGVMVGILTVASQE